MKILIIQRGTSSATYNPIKVGSDLQQVVAKRTRRGRTPATSQNYCWFFTRHQQVGIRVGGQAAANTMYPWYIVNEAKLTQHQVFISKRGRMKVQEREKPGRRYVAKFISWNRNSNPKVAYAAYHTGACIISTRLLLQCFPALDVPF